MRAQGRPSTKASNWARLRLACRAAPAAGQTKVAMAQPAGGQPDADAINHQHFHPIGPLVKQVGRVRVGRAEDLHDTGQGRIGAGAHVQRLCSEPHRIDPDHRSQAAQSAAAATG